MTHGRYPYRPVTGPVPYRRRRGGGLAVHVAANLEAYAFDAAVLDELVPVAGRPDLINHGWLDWGDRVGAWRLLDAMREAGVPATAPGNADPHDAAPGLVEA